MHKKQGIRAPYLLRVLLLAILTLAGCENDGNQENAVDLKLIEKARRIADLAVAIRNEYSDPERMEKEQAEYDRIFSQTTSNTEEKVRRISKNQSYEDIDARNYELLAQLKELGKRTTALAEESANALVDFDSFLASASNRCDDAKERNARIIASMKKKARILGNSTTSYEESFWAAKWKYDSELEKSSTQPNCEKLVPLINEMMTETELRMAEAEALTKRLK